MRFKLRYISLFTGTTVMLFLFQNLSMPNPRPQITTLLTGDNVRFNTTVNGQFCLANQTDNCLEGTNPEIHNGQLLDISKSPASLHTFSTGNLNKYLQLWRSNTNMYLNTPSLVYEIPSSPQPTRIFHNILSSSLPSDINGPVYLSLAVKISDTFEKPAADRILIYQLTENPEENDPAFAIYIEADQQQPNGFKYVFYSNRMKIAELAFERYDWNHFLIETLSDTTEDRSYLKIYYVKNGGKSDANQMTSKKFSQLVYYKGRISNAPTNKLSPSFGINRPAGKYHTAVFFNNVGYSTKALEALLPRTFSIK